MRHAQCKSQLYHGGVRAPPGVVMVALSEMPRNAERAQCEGRANEVSWVSAASLLQQHKRLPGEEVERVTVGVLVANIVVESDLRIS